MVKTKFSRVIPLVSIEASMSLHQVFRSNTTGISCAQQTDPSIPEKYQLLRDIIPP